jgi:hypothetical protein
MPCNIQPQIIKTQKETKRILFPIQFGVSSYAIKTEDSFLPCEASALFQQVANCLQSGTPRTIICGCGIWHKPKSWPLPQHLFKGQTGHGLNLLSLLIYPTVRYLITKVAEELRSSHMHLSYSGTRTALSMYDLRGYEFMFVVTLLGSIHWAILDFHISE